jgi:SAM-dependent methyltransferase
MSVGETEARSAVAPSLIRTPAPTHHIQAHPNFYSKRFRDLSESCLAHLASLNLPIAGRSVLELGSGPGDHTGFYLDRGCWVRSIDAREQTLAVLKQRHPSVETRRADLDTTNSLYCYRGFDVIHCYGLLYHLEHPEWLIRDIGKTCDKFAILCTAVSSSSKIENITTREDPSDDTQSPSGKGCRPSRSWVFTELSKWFPHVYSTATQPDNEEFPLDWDAITNTPTWDGITHHNPQVPTLRCVFVASKFPIDNPLLIAGLPYHQERFTGVTR